MTPIRRVLALTLPLLAAALLLVGSAAAKSSVTVFCGMHVTSNLTLSHDLDCAGAGGAALIAGNDGVVINLGGHTIFGDSSTSGVFASGWSNVVVRNGKIKNVDYAVDFEDADGSTAANIAATNVSETAFFGIASTGITFQSDSATNAQYGFLLGDTNNSTITKASVNTTLVGIEVGAEAGAVNNVVSKSSVTLAYDVAFENFGPTSSTTWTGNKVYNAQNGFVQEEGGMGTNLTGSKIDYVDYGIVFDQEGDGAVSASNNTVSRAYSVGFLALGTFDGSCLCATAPGSTFTGNTVKGSYSDAFVDVESLNNTWTGNTATGNDGTGFVFIVPFGAVITGNTAKSNTSTGFVLLDNDPGSGDNAQTFANNTATSNGDGGMYADFVQGGSGNVAKKNVPYDCYQIACQSSAHIPAVAPARPAAAAPAWHKLAVPHFARHPRS